MSSAALASCAYCGLPTAVPSNSQPAYCCFGCKLASDITGSDAAGAHDKLLLTRLGLAIFFAMNVLAFTMALWTQEVYDHQSDHLHQLLQSLFRWLVFLFSLPVLYLLGEPLAQNAWDNMRRGVFSTDLLLLLGVVASVIVSIPAVLREAGPVYFEIGVAVLVFVTLGRWLEARSKHQAIQALDSLERLLPDNIAVMRDGQAAPMALREVAIGDLLLVRAGQRIACDGTIEGNEGMVDDQIWTGESEGRVVSVGENVRAGLLNLSSDLCVRVTALPHQGALARLTELMREARRTRGPYERLADRLARWFLPLVAVVAFATTWTHAVYSGLEQGIFSGLAVVVIACPCALGIATPLAIWAALGSAARRGILFQSGDTLERLARIQAICFDKTGTLTEGRSRIASWQVEDASQTNSVLSRAGALARASSHGHSRAIAELASQQGADFFRQPLSIVVTLPGRGLESTMDGETVWLGSPRLLEEKEQIASPALRQCLQVALEQGQPIVGIAWAGRVRAWFVMEESLRPRAKESLDALRARGLAVTILTGDHRRRGRLLSQQVGIPVETELLPEDKWRRIAELRSTVGPVGMVGDGINDSPALAHADVGIAMGCGADLARASAGVCLLGNDLSQIPWMVDLARRTLRTVRLNLFWALAYNVAGMGLACSGRLNPVWAALIMVISSLLVIANSMRLTKVK